VARDGRGGSNRHVRSLPLLRLLRVGTLFSPAADVVAGACVVGSGWSPDIVRAALASVCLYAAGMVWNDVADRRLDAVQRPERPLPRGDLTVGFAVRLGVALLLAGLVLSPCRVHHGAIAALVLLYDFAGKRLAWSGALLMGTLRGLNLATALAFARGPAAGHTELVVAAVCYGVYIVGVTALGICEDLTPDALAKNGRAILGLHALPPAAALGGLVVAQHGIWPAPALAALPIAAFLVRAVRLARGPGFDQRALRGSMTFLLLGTMLYTALLALAAGQPLAALCIAAAIVPARRISRAIALT
jgi:4-hydroxybenzoate polyprenyltransferase